MAPAASAESSTGAPKTETTTATATAAAAEESNPPSYVDEGKAPPPEKVSEVQGEEVKEKTDEVSLSVCGRSFYRFVKADP